MKNKIKIYLLLIALGIGSVSCLDKYPDDAIQAGQAIKTVDDANQAITWHLCGIQGCFAL